MQIRTTRSESSRQEYRIPVRMLDTVSSFSLWRSGWKAFSTSHFPSILLSLLFYSVGGLCAFFVTSLSVRRQRTLAGEQRKLLPKSPRDFVYRMPIYNGRRWSERRWLRVGQYLSKRNGNEVLGSVEERPGVVNTTCASLMQM